MSDSERESTLSDSLNKTVEWNAIVNGKQVAEKTDSNAMLLDVLRDNVGTLGVKRGCDLGTCGCCAVLVDGEPKLSCLTFAGEAKGAEITTVEGLSNGHILAPLQETFTTYGGSQCGFCSPGFLVVATALLEANDNPSDEEIKTAIEGNLCRCTGFQPIVDSIRAAAALKRADDAGGDVTSAHSDPHPGFTDETTSHSDRGLTDGDA